jgi:hypothetical protein
MTKSNMVERLCEHFHKLKTHGIPVHYVWLDPVGENHRLAALQPIDFEFMSRDTPQQNSPATLAFPYLARKARAMMGGARVPEDIKSKVALEAISCAMQLDGLVMVEAKGKVATRDMHMFGANPMWSNKLRICGEAGVMAEGQDSKTGDRGASMMFVCYAERESDIVRLWDMHTSRVIVSRDIIWLKQMFFKDDASGVIDLDTLENLDCKLGLELVVGLGAKDERNVTSTSPTNNQPDKPGGSMTWQNPIVTGPGTVCTTSTGHVIRPPDRLTYAPAVELRDLGEMAELDHGELANMYLAL